jgi:excisionase family DNA binding protein
MGNKNLIDRVAQITEPLTVATTANLLAVSEDTIYRLIEQGEIPSFRFLSSIRIDPQDLVAFLQAKQPLHK